MKIYNSVKPSDRSRLERVVAVLTEEKIPFEVIANRSLPEVLKAVAAIRKGNAVFFTPIYREHEGRGIIPAHVLKKMHEIARCPIFSTHDVTLGFGVVGGFMYSARKLGGMAGEAVVGFVTGSKGTKLKTSSGYAYDWNEVVRWGYQDRIHENANIFFREPTMWERYRLEMLFAAIVFLLLALLTGVLFIVNGKLLNAKKSLRREKSRLEARVRERTEKLSRLHKKAETMARMDALTGVSNRHNFIDFWNRELAAHIRHSRPLALLMLDIDHFKAVNDNYGHAVGDKALIFFAQVSAKELRPADCIARLGGEEFGILLPDTNTEQARHVAERIRATVEHMTQLQDSEIPAMTVSVGVAEIQEETELEEIIQKADKALYRAKEDGRNRVCVI